MKRVILGAVVLLGAGFGAGWRFHERRTEPLLQQHAWQRAAFEEKWSGALREFAALQRSREESVEETVRERRKVEEVGRELATLQARMKELEARRETAVPVRRHPTGKPFSKMVKDPKLKEFMKNPQVAMLDMQYGRLFDHFQLSPAERQELKGLVAEKMRCELELSGPEGDAKKTAVDGQSGKRRMEELDGQIRTFLNNDADYAVYRGWEETKALRMQVSLLGPAFSGVGEPLSFEQEEKLVWEMQKAASQGGAEGPAGGFNPEIIQGGIAPELGERLLRDLDRQSARLLDAAAGFLSPAQWGALKQAQQNERKMAEQGIRRMTGSGN
jgi:hypothetical protein